MVELSKDNISFIKWFIIAIFVSTIGIINRKEYKKIIISERVDNEKLLSTIELLKDLKNG